MSLSVFPPVIFSLLLFGIASFNLDFKDFRINFLRTPLNSVLNNSAFLDLKNSKIYQGLPVASVKSYNVSNAKGTVVFLPQYHKNPGSENNDSENDSPEKSQEEIYSILKFLTKTANLDFMMIEGELYGKVPAEKITTIAQKIENRYKFSKLEEQKMADRDILLRGAALKLKAESGKSITLYGSENVKTQEESKVIVKNYIYLQDRMDQIEKSGISLSGGSSLNSSSLGISSKAGNPYKSVSNPKKLKQLLVDAENKIDKIVVERRNKETAENFAKALKKENKNIGVLQFGAGHQEGLVKELNKQGLSVIVVTSSEVANRSSKGS